jgi:DNA-binding NarL/FixJ family response regulator
MVENHMKTDNGTLIRVAVQDDKLLMMRGISSVIESAADMQLIIGTDDWESLMQLVATQLVDIVITGVGASQDDKQASIQRLKNTSPQTSILMISDGLHDAHFFNYFEAGISAYIKANASDYQLLGTIRSIYAGQAVIDLGIFQQAISTYMGAKTHGPMPIDDLSMRELEVLSLAAKGLGNKGIALRLALSERTIHGYLRSIYGKMRVKSRTEAIYRAAVNGWIKLN